MEFTPLFVLVGIVVTSGFIGYVCDIVGKKLGKKRLSLFGLRPRHTATAGTVLVAAVISITSIGLMTVGSKDARDWIIKGGTAMRDLKVNQAKLKETEEERAKISSDLSSEKLLLGAQNDKMVSQKRHLDLETGQVKLERTKLGELEEKQAALRLTAAKESAEISEDNNEILNDNKELAKTNLTLNSVRAQINRVVEASHKSQMASREEIAKETASIAMLKATLKPLEKTRDRLLADIHVTQTDLDSTNSQLDAKNRELVAKNRELDNAQLQIDSLEAQRQSFIHSIIDPSRYGNMVYRVHQEVARIDLPAHLTVDQAQEGLADLLQKARIEASGHGAAPRGQHSAAEVMGSIDPSTNTEISANDREARAVQSLVDNAQPLVLMACASVNAFEKEPVPLDLFKYSNPLVYTKGQVVAESKIDGSESRPEVFKQLNQFFAISLSEKARKDNMIPDPEDQFAEQISTDQLYGLVDTVKLKGRQVRLVAKAQTDTHAADPLKLDFEVQ